MGNVTVGGRQPGRESIRRFQRNGCICAGGVLGRFRKDRSGLQIGHALELDIPMLLLLVDDISKFTVKAGAWCSIRSFNASIEKRGRRESLDLNELHIADFCFYCYGFGRQVCGPCCVENSVRLPCFEPGENDSILSEISLQSDHVDVCAKDVEA